MTQETKKILVYSKYCDLWNPLANKYKPTDITGQIESIKKYFDEVIRVDHKILDKKGNYKKHGANLELEIDLSNKQILSVGRIAHDYLKKKVDFGLRNTNTLLDCTRLPQLKLTELNSSIVFIERLDNSEEVVKNIKNYFNPQMTTPIVKDPRLNFFNTIDSAIDVLSKMANYKGDIGMDFETSALSDDPDMEVIGVGLALSDRGCYIDWRLLKLEDEKRFESEFLPAFKRLLDKKHREIIVFNYSFEMQVCYRLFQVHYKFIDSGIYRRIDGLHEGYNWSLKYTAQYYLKVGNWDADYDKLMKKLTADELILKDRGYLEATLEAETDYDRKTILEFLKWYDLGYQSEFTVIPTSLIGKYCILDAYYTLKIHELKKMEYSDLCIDVFNANNKFAARITPPLLNVELADRFTHESYDKWIKYSLILAFYYLDKSITTLKKSKVQAYNKSSKSIQKLLNKRYNLTSVYYLGKDFLMDVFEEGADDNLNTGLLYELFGSSYLLFAETLTTILPKDWTWDGISRKRNIITAVGKELIDTLDVTLEELEEINEVGYFKSAIEDIKRIAKEYESSSWANKTIEDKRGIKARILKIWKLSSNDEIYKYRDLRHYSDYFKKIMDVCEWKGHIYNFEAIDYNINKTVSNDLTHLNSLEEVLDEIDKVKTVGKKADYKKVDEIYKKKSDDKEGDIKKHDIRLLFRDGSIKVSEIVEQEADNYVQSMFSRPFDDIVKEYETNPRYLDCFVPYACRGYAKYEKLLTSYLESYFVPNFYCESDNLMVPKPETVNNEGIGQPRHRFRWGVNSKDTKRWDSDFHTIPSDSITKRCIMAPPGSYFSYFDIAAAEVRSIAYYSQDPVLMHYFDNGIDPYTEALLTVYPNADSETKKKLRQKFKGVLLGLFFGMGSKTMANNIGSTEEEAKSYVQAILNKFPKLGSFVEDLREYTKKHGRANSALGDMIYVDRKNYMTKGVNSVIQSNTSVLLVYGFNNLLEKADEEGMNIVPLSVVHDSSTAYNLLENLHKTYDFYDKHFRQFVKDKVTTNYAFDLMIGVDYWSQIKLGPTNDKGYSKLSGSSYELKLFIDHARKTHKVDYIALDGFDENVTPTIDATKANNLYTGHVVFDGLIGDKDDYKSIEFKVLERL